MAACAEGNLELVNRIASKFESPEELCEAEPSTGYTPLMMAARHGHLDVVEALIRLGHDSTEISRVRHTRRLSKKQSNGFCVRACVCRSRA